MGVVISYIVALIMNAAGFTNPDGSAILNFSSVASSVVTASVVASVVASVDSADATAPPYPIIAVVIDRDSRSAITDFLFISLFTLLDDGNKSSGSFSF